MNELPLFQDAVFGFDARGVAKRFRHAAIFGALEALHDGETMRFMNDHDPVPLLGQIEQRYGNQINGRASPAKSSLISPFRRRRIKAESTCREADDQS